MKKSVALITGITGQDGSYLAELLLSKGYKVVGLVRHNSAQAQTQFRIAHLLNGDHDLHLATGDLCDLGSLKRVIYAHNPQEIYNLAAQSYVPESWNTPVHTCAVTGMGVLNMLEAVREVAPTARFYQASSSEMFGAVLETPQRVSTPFNPRSPYAVAKVFGHQMTRHYREAYGIYACSGILFNHESPRRGEEFVTRKITKAAARIAAGMQSTLYLGNLDACRDWGFAGDYVEAMWMMLRQTEPRDFVIGTGTQCSVRDFVKIAFEHFGMNYEDYVRIDPAFFRPAEVNTLLADPHDAEAALGWTAHASLHELVRMMCYADEIALREQKT